MKVDDAVLFYLRMCCRGPELRSRWGNNMAVHILLAITGLTIRSGSRGKDFLTSIYLDEYAAVAVV